MSASLSGLATSLVADLGYGGLTAGLFLDSFGFPLPSEVLIPLAVVDAERGHLALWLVVAVSIAAQVVGALTGYAIGRRAGLPAVKRFGRYVFISPAHLDRAERVFARYGGWIAGVGRCLPVVRGLIAFPAGAARMPLVPFVAWTAVGSAIWTAVLVGLGEALSTNIGVIDRVFSRVTVVFTVVIVVALLYAIRRGRRRALAARRARDTSTEAVAARD